MNKRTTTVTLIILNVGITEHRLTCTVHTHIHLRSHELNYNIDQQRLEVESLFALSV